MVKKEVILRIFTQHEILIGEVCTTGLDCQEELPKFLEMLNEVRTQVNSMPEVLLDDQINLVVASLKELISKNDSNFTSLLLLMIKLINDAREREAIRIPEKKDQQLQNNIKQAHKKAGEERSYPKRWNEEGEEERSGLFIRR